MYETQIIDLMPQNTVQQINIPEGARTAISSAIEDSSFPHTLFRQVTFAHSRIEFIFVAIHMHCTFSSIATKVQLEVLGLMGAENLDRFKAGKAFRDLLIRVGGYTLDTDEGDAAGLLTLIQTNSREQTRRSIEDPESISLLPPQSFFERLTSLAKKR